MTHKNPDAPRRVLVVCAHPDDAEFTSAGTIATWTGQGSEVWYIVCTAGNRGTKDHSLNPHQLAQIREEEQQAAAKVLGVREVVFLRYGDGELQGQESLPFQMSLLIRHLRPEMVVTHDAWRLHQIHPDHRATGLGVTDGIIAARDHLFLPAQMVVGLAPHHTPEVYLFGTDNADQFFDITETIDRKIEALGQHRSQVERIAGWESRVKQWASMAGEKIGVRYAESFKKLVLF